MSIAAALFKSRLTAVLTLIGMAVGLGNVWRFPYMMGSYGGSAFLAIYLVFTFILVIPGLIAEMHLGRKTRNGTIGAFRFVFGKQFGPLVGYLLVIVIILASSYYGIVVSNVVFTTGYSLVVGFSDLTIDNYHTLLSSSWIQYLLTISVVIASLVVVAKGLNQGIEWVSRRIMPFFVLSMVYIIIHTLTIPGAIEKLLLFLKPNFQAMGPSEIYAALGQAFFSAGLGGTFVIVYSGYMHEKEKIDEIALYTGFGDLGSSLLISLFLVPAVLVFNLEMDSGPNLIFQTLPQLFAFMPGGRLVGTLFLLSISLVALLSLIAAYEVVITSLNHELKNISRNKLILGFLVLQFFLIIPSIVRPQLIGILDLILGSGMQVFGSLMAIVGVTWFLKSKKAFQVRIGSNLLFHWTKWVVPVILTTILILYIYNNISIR